MLAELRDDLRQLAPERHGRGVDDAVDRVEPEGVDVVLVEPVHRVAAEEAAHLVASRPVDVDRLTPRRVVAAAHVRGEPLEVVALGPDVVVDDVEDDGEPARVAGVDESPQAVGPTVGRLRRPEVDPVVAPVARSRELGDRQDLAGRDAELDEVVQPLDRRVERALGRERADVQLVQHELGQRRRLEQLVGPRERGRVDDRRGSVDAVGLPARCRVGKLVPAVQAIAVARARRRLHRRRAVAVGAALHGHEPLVAAEQVQLHVLGAWRPDTEVVEPLVEPRRTEHA